METNSSYMQSKIFIKMILNLNLHGLDCTNLAIPYQFRHHLVSMLGHIAILKAHPLGIWKLFDSKWVTTGGVNVASTSKC